MSLTYNSFYYPLGKGNAAVNFDSKIKDLKSKYYDKISKEILVSCVFNKNKDRYTFFFKIPSENDKYPTALFYDTVLEFIPPKGGEKAAKAAGSLQTYDINIFSNSPGFVFTFDYPIKHRYNAFPKTLPFGYLSRIAVDKAPVIRNSAQVMTIEKTTWWSLFHLDHNGYLNKDSIVNILSKENESYFYKKIATQPIKLKEINDLNNVLREEKLQEMAKKNEKEAEKIYKNTSKIRSTSRDPLAYSFQVANMKSNPLLSNKMKIKNRKDPLKMKGFFNPLKK